MPQEPLNLEVEGELKLKSASKRLEPATEAAEPHRSEGGELFIVDNSDSEWKGLKYLQDWTEIAKAFDVASGFFEIGSLLALDQRWQKLDTIRILLGADMSTRTRQALLEGLKKRTEEVLDQSIEEQKEQNDFLNGVPAIVDGVRSGKIECKVYLMSEIDRVIGKHGGWPGAFVDVTEASKQKP